MEIYCCAFDSRENKDRHHSDLQGYEPAIENHHLPSEEIFISPEVNYVVPIATAPMSCIVYLLD